MSLRPMLTLTALLLTLTVTSQVAFARPEMVGQTAADRFHAMDADKDGKLTKEEFLTAQPQMREGAFLAIDVNSDGSVELSEWEQFSSNHAKGSMGGMGGSTSPAATDPHDHSKDGPAAHTGEEQKPGLLMPSLPK